MQFNSQQGSSVSTQSGMGLGVQSPNLSGISSASLQQPPNSVHSPSSQQPLIPGVAKDAGIFCDTLCILDRVLLNNFSPLYYFISFFPRFNKGVVRVVLILSRQFLIINTCIIQLYCFAIDTEEISFPPPEIPLLSTNGKIKKKNVL